VNGILADEMGLVRPRNDPNYSSGKYDELILSFPLVAGQDTSIDFHSCIHDGDTGVGRAALDCRPEEHTK
jgi:hypothetical protein